MDKKLYRKCTQEFYSAIVKKDFLTALGMYFVRNIVELVLPFSEEKLGRKYGVRFMRNPDSATITIFEKKNGRPGISTRMLKTEI